MQWTLPALVKGLTPFFFNKKNNNTIEGHTYPNKPNALDLGTAENPFRNVYAQNLIGPAPENDELVKVSGSDPSAGYLQSKISGVGAISLATSTSSMINITLNTSTLLLRDGSNSLTGNLAVASSVTIDGVDIGSPGDGIEVSSNAYRIRLHSNAGLSFNSGQLQVNNGSRITKISNVLDVDQSAAFTWTGQHQFNVAPNINANLNFMGGNRSITASNSLTISPTSDLLLSPGGGNVTLTDTRTFRSSTFTDAVTGINGFSLFDRGGTKRQLTIGVLKADEMFVRVLTFDENRVNRGSEFWSRSFGYVETGFDLPAINGSVDVWFEEAPDLDSSSLFLNNNWLQCRTVDINNGGPSSAMMIWFQVVKVTSNGYIQREDAVDGSPGVPSKLSRQQWRLIRRSGGVTSATVRAGNLMVDFGIPLDFSGALEVNQFKGQGVVALTAIDENDGPNIHIQTFRTVLDGNPLFDTHVRMGMLRNAAGITGNVFGFAAGDDLGKTPATGFSGLVARADQGLLLYNTDIKLYESGGILAAMLKRNTGLSFRNDSASFAHDARVIAWYDDLDALGFATAKISSWGDSDDRRLQLSSFSTDWSAITLSANGDGGADSAAISIKAGGWESVTGGLIQLTGAYVTHSTGDSIPRFRIGGDVGAIATSNLHISYNTTAINDTAGVLIDQSGTGDSVLHWRQMAPGPTTVQAYSMGIDNSDSDKFKLSVGVSLGANDILIYNPVDGSVIINGLDLSGGSGVTGLVAGDGISIAGTTISVNSSVVRDSRTITAGDGLTGGGSLAANRTFAVDTTVVRTTRTISTSGGLQGGGNLGSNLSLSIALATNSGLNTTSGLAVDASLAGGGLVLSAGIMAVGAGDGIAVTANEVSVDATIARSNIQIIAGDGLTGGGNLTANRTLNVVALSTGGLQANADSIQIKLATNPGLQTDANGLAIASSLAGNGLSYSAGVLTVGAGAGITVGGTTVGVNLAANSGLTTTGGLQINTGLAGAGLVYSAGVMDVGAGNGISVASNSIAINLAANSGLIVDGSGLYVNSGIAGAGSVWNSGVIDIVALSTGGLQANANNIQIKLATTSGLQTNANGLFIGEGFGITVGTSSIAVKPASVSAIESDASGIYLKDSLAGNGLSLSGQALSVNVSNGLEINSDSVRVNQAFNFAWTGDHTFTTGVVTFNADPQINANLDFIGGSRAITGSSIITLAPVGDLILNPGGVVSLPDAGEFRTSTFNDLIGGIQGFRLFRTGAGVRQLTIPRVKTDEIIAKSLVYDQIRLDRGSEHWSKSYGIVSENFTVTSIDSTYDVWFENSTGLDTANVFSVGDYIMLQVIDWDNGIETVTLWFTVDSLLTNGSVDGYNQQWRLDIVDNPSNDIVIKAGAVALDAGNIGYGWIHLSALDQDGGPFIQIGEFDSLSSGLPVHVNKVRMGQLSGVAGLTGDKWGFAAGNDLGLSPSSGDFKGFTIETDNGFQIYNGAISMYDTYSKNIYMAPDAGFRIRSSDSSVLPTQRIMWLADVNEELWIGDTPIGVSMGGTDGNFDGYSVMLDTIIRSNSAGTPALRYQIEREDGNSTLLYVNGSLGSMTLSSQMTMDLAIAADFTVRHNNDGKTGHATVAIENLGNNGSDAYLRMKSVNSTIYNEWSVGVDASLGGVFSISTGSSLGGSSSKLEINPSDGLVVIQNSLHVKSSIQLDGPLVANWDIGAGRRILLEAVRPRTATTFNFENNGGTVVAGISNGGSLFTTNGISIGRSVNSTYYGNLDVSGSGVNGWVYLRGNTGGSGGPSTDVNYGLMIGWNQSNGSGETRILHGIGAGGNPALIFGTWDGTTQTAFVTMRNNRMAVGVDTGNPVSVLHLKGPANNTGGITIESNSGATAQRLKIFATGGHSSVIQSVSNGDIQFQNSSGNVFVNFVATNGRVGINASSPSSSLHVRGTNNNTGGITITSSAGTDTDRLAIFPLGNFGSSIQTLSTDNTAQIQFRDGSNNTYMSLHSTTGNVNFGDNTTIPVGKVDVTTGAADWGVVSTTFGNISGQFIARRALGTISSPTQVTSGTTIGRYGAVGYHSSGWPTTPSAYIDFTAESNHTSSNRKTFVRIHGTPSTNTTVDTYAIFGDFTSFFKVYGNTSASAPNMYISADHMVYRSTNPSSVKYKENIANLQIDDNFFDDINVVTFNYKPELNIHDGEKMQIGLIAEEVHNAGGGVLVNYDELGNPDSIKYEKLPLVMISEIQSLRKRIAELEKLVKNQ